MIDDNLPPDWQRAERLLFEGSFAQSATTYAELLTSLPTGPASEGQRRWLTLRRLQARLGAAGRSDDDDYEALQREVVDLLRVLERAAESGAPGDVREPAELEPPELGPRFPTAQVIDLGPSLATLEEAAGDAFWVSEWDRDPNRAWEYYSAALDRLAGWQNLDEARRRYLDIVFRASDWEAGVVRRGSVVRSFWVDRLPLEIAENAARIAVDPPDRTHASLLYALALARLGSQPRFHDACRDAFEEAIASGRYVSGRDGVRRENRGHDHALMQYAQWLARSGRLERTDGGTRQRPDLVGALAVLGRIVSEFSEGESAYYRQAQSLIQSLTQAALDVQIHHAFLPDQPIELFVEWRNLESFELRLYRLDASDDQSLMTTFQNLSGGGVGSPLNWYRDFRVDQLEVVQRARIETVGWESHEPGRSLVEFDGLSAGLYLVQAHDGGFDARGLLWVTRTSVITKASPGGLAVWVVDAETGSPLEGAGVEVYSDRGRRNRNPAPQTQSGRTNGDGLVRFETQGDGRRLSVLVGHEHGPSFVHLWSSGRGHRASWRVHAFSDRPAYRPGDQIHWKAMVRERSRGDGSWETPAGTALLWTLLDPRGEQVAEGTGELNAFGSLWGELELEKRAVLGTYSIEFKIGERLLGRTELFRLEEYKLPEIRVTATARPVRDDETPGETEPGRSPRVGQPVEVIVSSEFYFGGPVEGAEVEVLVRRRPWYPTWWGPDFDPERPAWLEESSSTGNGRFHGGGGGEVIHNATLFADENGEARFVVATDGTPIETAAWELEVEARVRDSSRREVVGKATVRLATQAYEANLRATQRLYQPDDEVEVELRTRTVDQQPVEASGSLRVVRRYWEEKVVDAKGRPVPAGQVARSRRQKEPLPRDWVVLKGTWREEEILTTTIASSDSGLGSFRFTPTNDGFYVATYRDDSEAAAPVEAETQVWVGSGQVTDLGWRHGGIRVVTGQSFGEAGSVLPVMISAPVSGRWALFSVEGEALYQLQVLKLGGEAHFLEIPLERLHVPNIVLAAATVFDLQTHLDQEAVRVAPSGGQLDVRVSLGLEEIGPAEEGEVLVEAFDEDGNPVDAEISLAVIDEAVLAIQEDLAPDPRARFWGESRAHAVRTSGSFQSLNFFHPELMREQKERRDHDLSAGQSLDMLADTAGEAAMSVHSLAVSEAPVARKMAAPAPPGGDSGAGDVVVRTDFRATALWIPDLTTGTNGLARATVNYPETLTRWRARAVAATAADRFGQGETFVRTKKDLLVRLQTPRFLVVGDRATLAVVVHNATERTLEATVDLEIEGDALRFLDGALTGQQGVALSPGDTRVDFEIDAEIFGDAAVTAVVRSAELSDAMQLGIPVVEHGIEKLVTDQGLLRRGDDGTTLRFDLPPRRDGSTGVTVQVAPSLAVTVLDALPYLIDYPYGCVEQTLSRFMPTVVTARTLERLGLEREEVLARSFGGTSASWAADNPQKQPSEKLDDVVSEGLARLLELQRTDGAWGWWSGGDADPWMTAYAVWTLALADEAGVDLEGVNIRGAREFLRDRLVEEQARPVRQAFMVHALSAWDEEVAERDARLVRAMEDLWNGRGGLTPYGLALVAISAKRFGDDQRADVLVRNLSDGVVKTSLAGYETAHWGSRSGWWHWSEGAVEATAFVLQALVAIDSENPLAEAAMRWLVQNRRGAQWNNTRDTAIAVIALDAWLEARGELSQTVGWQVVVGGEVLAEHTLSGNELLSAPTRVVVPSSALQDGTNTVEIRRTTGVGPLYLGVEARFFSLEEPIPPASSEVAVKRAWARKVARPTLLEGVVWEDEPLAPGDRVESGDRIAVTVEIEASNDFEYLIVDDWKPAGFESVELRSGGRAWIERVDSKNRRRGTWGSRRYVHRELRDQKVVHFIDSIEQGTWRLTYELRAETPGTFHGLPTIVEAMYVPEVRANGAEAGVLVRGGE